MKYGTNKVTYRIDGRRTYFYANGVNIAIIGSEVASSIIGGEDTLAEFSQCILDMVSYCPDAVAK